MLARCPVHPTGYVCFSDNCVRNGKVKPLDVFVGNFLIQKGATSSKRRLLANTFRPSHHPVAIGLLATLRQTYRRENPTVQYAFEIFVLNVFAIRTN